MHWFNIKSGKVGNIPCLELSADSRLQTGVLSYSGFRQLLKTFLFNNDDDDKAIYTVQIRQGSKCAFSRQF